MGPVARSQHPLVPSCPLSLRQLMLQQLLTQLAVRDLGRLPSLCPTSAQPTAPAAQWELTAAVGVPPHALRPSPHPLLSDPPPKVVPVHWPQPLQQPPQRLPPPTPAPQPLPQAQQLQGWVGWVLQEAAAASRLCAEWSWCCCTRPRASCRPTRRPGSPRARTSRATTTCASPTRRTSPAWRGGWRGARWGWCCLAAARGGSRTSACYVPWRMRASR
mmetsp:Transcript_16804/g.42061  ORF Transcript_16804/g.42061 Transcript_16804/m.42061 type:complete len:217 (+) Transcript_16804:2095-2745(+)